jgi:hypothetical protein
MASAVVEWSLRQYEAPVAAVSATTPGLPGQRRNNGGNSFQLGQSRVILPRASVPQNSDFSDKIKL